MSRRPTLSFSSRRRLGWIEVKGGDVRRQDGAWEQRQEGHWRPIHPVRQAQDCRHVLQRSLARYGAKAARSPGVHMVALPDRDAGDGFEAPGFPRSMLIDRQDLKQIVHVLLRALKVHGQGDELSQAGAVEMTRLLTGPNLAAADISDPALVAQEPQDAPLVLRHLTNALLMLGVKGEGQRVFDRLGSSPIELEPFPLDSNLRNTKRIAQVFGSLCLEQPRYEGLEGPPVRFIACSSDEAVDAADSEVERLTDVEGWPPGSLALLTTKHRHPVQTEVVAGRGWDAYWNDFFAADDVFYGHVLGFKALSVRSSCSLSTGSAMSRVPGRCCTWD